MATDEGKGKTSTVYAKDHDSFFKLVMKNKAAAKEVMQQFLDPALVDKIDWQSLQQIDTHNVDAKLSETISDVVYQGKFASGEGCLFCFVLEHYSSVKAYNTTFKMHRYVLDAMEKHIDPETGLAPIVFSALFYHGERPYPYKHKISDYFPESYRSLGEHYLINSMRLIDVNKTPDETLAKLPTVGPMALIQKYIYSKNMLEELPRIFLLLHKLLPNMPLNARIPLGSVIEYVVSKGRVEDAQAVSQVLQDIFEGNDMYIAEALKKEGERIGLQRGREEGREEVAANMLRRGIDIEIVVETSGLPRGVVEGLASLQGSDRTEH